MGENVDCYVDPMCPYIYLIKTQTIIDDTKLI